MCVCVGVEYRALSSHKLTDWKDSCVCFFRLPRRFSVFILFVCLFFMHFFCLPLTRAQRKRGAAMGISLRIALTKGFRNKDRAPDVQ